MVELHYNDDNTVYQEDFESIPPQIALAYRHYVEINRKKQRWCRMEVMIQPEGHVSVMNFIGPVMTDGRKEGCLRIRTYSVRNGEVIWYDSIQS